jgi:hypothetical protein
VKTCHACKKDPSIGRSVGRRDACPFCGADLHCCLNCKFYDPSVSKRCREPAAMLVKEKTKANFCDFFMFAEAKSARSDATDARRMLDDLFKK